MSAIKKEVIEACKEKLLSTKMDLLNQINNQLNDFSQRDHKGDECDQSVNMLAEHQYITAQERLRTKLLEIEQALGKIEMGNYGICEETQEFIEPQRLMAIPWTRLSLEGAEIRENLTKKFFSL